MPVAIDFVAAEAGASPSALLRLADAIYLTRDCDCPRCWAGDALARWPGCLVTVARAGPGGCVAATRGQAPVLLRVRPGDAGDQVLRCAALAYWWTVSGRPLALLADRYVAALPCGGDSPSSSDASSPRTSSASGAAVASNPASAAVRCRRAAGASPSSRDAWPR